MSKDSSEVNFLFPLLCWVDCGHPMGNKGSKVTLQVVLLGKKQVESLAGGCSPPLGRTQLALHHLFALAREYYCSCEGS